MSGPVPPPAAHGRERRAGDQLGDSRSAQAFGSGVEPSALHSPLRQLLREVFGDRLARSSDLCGVEISSLQPMAMDQDDVRWIFVQCFLRFRDVCARRGEIRSFDGERQARWDLLIERLCAQGWVGQEAKQWGCPKSISLEVRRRARTIGLK